MTMDAIGLARALGQQQERLIAEFAGALEPQVVRRELDLAARTLSGARVTLYVPVLADRLARERLGAVQAAQRRFPV
jgi:hypothetical protein